MKCKHCNADVNVLDSICPGCGKPLSALYGGSRPGSRSGSLLDQTSRLLDEELEEARRRVLGGQLRKLDDAVERIASLRLQNSRPPSKLNLLTGNRFEFRSENTDILQMAAFVFHSPHVQANKLYSLRAGETTFLYLSDRFEVNAFATDSPVEEIEHEPPLIVLFGGMVLVSRMFAIGLSIDQTRRTEESRQLLLSLIREIGTGIVKNQGGYPVEEAIDLLNRLALENELSDGETTRKARSYAAAMVLVVIAHELGHICLGHTLGDSLNDEIRRNQEREADSFAASVASASPFSDYIVAGGIFWWVIVTWVESVNGNRSETLHPFARDRLMDYIRSNRDQALSLGFDEQAILAFLP